VGMETDNSNNIKILWFCDGWEVKVGNRSYKWDHNDQDLGVNALSTLLKDLGYQIEIEEIY